MTNFSTDLLFVDTETAGLPTNADFPVIGALDHWPRTVQIAWERYSLDEKRKESHSYLIKPDGFEIPEGATEVHGITTEEAREKGEPLADVLAFLNRALQHSGILVAHNIQFDGKVLDAEYQRQEWNQNPIWHVPHFCTMRSSVFYCDLRDRRDCPKYPTLQELHQTLFGETFPNAHDALADVRACARCFFELERRGVAIS